MDLTKIELNGKQITGNEEAKALIVGLNYGYEYKDGKRTDNVTHWVTEAVCPNYGYAHQKVKVLDKNLPITAEQLKAKGEMRVKFKNLRGKIYRTGHGDYEISATADSLEVLS